ncbi:hypothetical protein K0M31_007762, partial [Melipona bicolor]
MALSSGRCCSILDGEVCGYFAVFLVGGRLSSDWLEQVGALDDARRADNQTCYECQASLWLRGSASVLFQRPASLFCRSDFFSLRLDICVPARFAKNRLGAFTAVIFICVRGRTLAGLLISFRGENVN